MEEINSADRVTLQDIRTAWEAKDPMLVEFVGLLATQPDPEPEQPPRKGALTFDRYLSTIRSLSFSKKPKEEQEQIRRELMQNLEADDAEVPLSDRLRAYEILLELWEADDPFARTCLLELIASLPLNYGVWRGLKRIFKEAEAKNDTEVFGALAARFDTAFATGGGEVNKRTLGYLARRGWRYLRRLGETLPASYPDAAVDVLANYGENFWHTRNSWIFNHIFYHETGDYKAKGFHLRRTGSLLKYRAFAELWKRSPRPLFSLLERAKSEFVRDYATTALKTDFRATLRDVEPAWVVRLISVHSRSIDDFVIWFLANVPKFEQAAFRELGLHEAVLRLCDSDSNQARAYAAGYARTHARDLPVSDLIRLANNNHQEVRKTAEDLLLALDPRKDVGLDSWGELLNTEYGNELATKSLRKHFGKRELTPEWFEKRLLSRQRSSVTFAVDNLLDVHPAKTLGAEFFCKVLLQFDAYPDGDYQQRRAESRAISFLYETLSKNFKLAELDQEFLKQALLHPQVNYLIYASVREGTLPAKVFPVDLLKTLAFEPQWPQDQWIADLKASDKPWAKDLEFEELQSQIVLNWLSDIREFSPTDLGFDWLMQLVKRSEPRYHDFAVETMIKAFLPADFAPADEAVQEEKAASGDGEINVDLNKQSFLFTGKLSTMTRSEAQGKVRTAGGSVASSVNAKLDYLVIGDEGSPLYGEGKKGSKQLAAEKLRDAGEDVKIISETAFLQMLAGEQREFSESTVEAGCERLWEMATGEGDSGDPLRKFALKYIRRHHPDICLAETDRPVDPGAEMPPTFMTFERFKPLYFDSRKAVRDFALEFASWEMSRWKPPMRGLKEMCESPYPEVRRFVSKALLADESPEHRRYRVDPEVLTPDAVYGFCESRDEGTRLLGMELILRHPRLRVPDELFRLTESADRKVRGFVIRAIWSLYHHRGITRSWQPVGVAEDAEATAKTAKKTPKRGKSAKRLKEKEEKEANRGTGAPPRPEQLPADKPEMRSFLRRILFEIPPAKLNKEKTEGLGAELKLKPPSARKAKLSLVEVMRDLAIEDAEFAAAVCPLLEEFKGSRGKSEHAACLVALHWIYREHPQLAPAEEMVEEAVS